MSLSGMFSMSQKRHHRRGGGGGGAENLSNLPKHTFDMTNSVCFSPDRCVELTVRNSGLFTFSRYLFLFKSYARKKIFCRLLDLVYDL